MLPPSPPPPHVPSRHLCQHLAHELRFFNLEAPQLDERLQPVLPRFRLVLVGGLPGWGCDPSNWLQYFDDKARAWGRLGDMRVRRPHSCGAAAIDGCLYAFGGMDVSDVDPQSTTKYTMATRKMEEVAKPPQALKSCTGVACDGLVYSLGGQPVQLPASVADVYVYNPETDSWLVGPPLPVAMQALAAVEHAGCIYACGGHSVGILAHPVSPSLLMLDPRMRTWAILPAMPSHVIGAGAAMVSGRLYVAGGAGAYMRCQSTTQCYDVVAGKWDVESGVAAMREGRVSPSVAALYGEVWAVGGITNQPAATCHGLTSVEVYSPRLNTWRQGIPLPNACGCHNTCVVLQVTNT